METSFSIIIVTWNALHHLKRFLPSVAATSYSNMEIIIANNASDDGTGEWVKKNYPECKIVTFDKNYGYCGGNNRAVGHASGDILIFLNNDVEVEPDWLQPLNVAFLETTTGVVQPKIRSVEQPGYFEYAGAAGGYIDWLGYPFCRGRLFDTVEKDTGQYDQKSPVFWASGAAFAIRKNLFLKTGGFDEDFEFHMEEIDLCWRCHKLGAKVLCEPESVVYHLGGGSMPMGSPRKVFYNYRNSLIMLTKNLDKAPLLKIFLRMILDGVSGVRSLLMGKPGETMAILKAHGSFYLRLRSALKKRRISSSSTLKKPLNNIIYQRLIILQYYIYGKKRYGDLPK